MTSLRGLGVLCCLWMLAACGGGGGGGGTTGAGGGSEPPPPAAPTYTIGGVLTGLPAGAVVTVGLGAESLLLRANGGFVGNVRVASGAAYQVQVITAPPDRRCTVSNGSGRVGTSDVTAVVVDCSAGLPWVASGDVHSAVLSPDRRTLYVAGNFDRLGPPTGSFVRVDPSTGALGVGLPAFNADVTDAIPDGVGGVYVAARGRGDSGGNSFVTEPRLWRLDANGVRDTRFNPVLPSYATALLRHGNRLFVALNWGIGNNVVVLDADTGAALGVGMRTAPALLNALAFDEPTNTLFVAGNFNRAGPAGAELSRAGLAAFDATTGVLRSWDAALTYFGSPAMRVASLALAGEQLVVAGTFTHAGGSTRYQLAALDVKSAQATAWQPLTPEDGGAVNRIVPRTDSVLVAGSFRKIGGASRAGVAEIDLRTGQATGWSPSLSDDPYTDVTDLALDRDRVYLSGTFGMGGQSAKAQSAAAMLNDGALLPTPLQLGRSLGTVRRLVPTAGGLWVGGIFTLYGGVARLGIAALDVQSGAATDFVANVEYETYAGTVAQVIFAGGAVVVRGEFTEINGTPRNLVAALDPVSGTVLPWDAALPLGLSAGWAAVVRSLASDGTRLYVGGTFRTFGGQARSNLAAVELSDWRLSAWAPVVNPVYVLAAAGDRVFGATAGPAIVAFEASTALPVSTWAPPALQTAPPGAPVESLVVQSPRVFVTGALDRVAGQVSGLAALDWSTGGLLNWGPSVVFDYERKYLSDGDGGLYLVRKKSTQADVSFWELFEVDPVTGAESSIWQADGDILAVARAPEGLYVAGRFVAGPGDRQHLLWLPR